MVRRVWVGFVILAAALAATAEDSAVTASRAERKRTGKISRHAEVVGNEELSAASGTAVLGQAGPEPQPAAEETPSPTSDHGTSDPSGTPAMDPAAAATAARLQLLEEELDWRERMAAARAHIESLKADIVYARQRLLIYRLGLVVPLDALAEFNRKPEIDALMLRVAELERALVAARLEPARIQQEARRKRIPPGWVR